MWNILRTVSKGEYNYAVVPGHPHATKNGYVLEHRVIMENHIGRLLSPSDEVVHHKDENKKNNNLSNLEIWSRSEHSKHHAQLPVMIALECTHCGLPFTRRGNQRKEVKGYLNSFCSRSCNGKFQRAIQLAPVSEHASNV